MARRRYRKYSRRRIARWSPNIFELNTTQISIPAGTTDFYQSYTLAQNPAQQPNMVTQTYTVKNFEVSFEIEQTGNTGYIEDLAAYIMFVPQGMTVTGNYNLEHPEYIMAYKFLGSPTQDNPTSMAQPNKIKSRLSRKLQSGDGVIVLFKGNRTDTQQTGSNTIYIHGLARWWTKAN